MERGAVMSKIVNVWPTSVMTDRGLECNPSPERCRELGYELAVPPTAEEIAQRAQVEAERVAVIEGLRTKYRDAVHRFCVLAGLVVVDKFENENVMQQAIETANGQGDFQKSLGLTQLSLAILNAINELRRHDGGDAWARI